MPVPIPEPNPRLALRIRDPRLCPDLHSITGGRGEYTMELEHYEKIPSHIAQKVIDAAHADDQEAVEA